MFNDMIQQYLSRMRENEQQQQYTSTMLDAARQPIPGLTGPVSDGAGIPGMSGTWNGRPIDSFGSPNSNVLGGRLMAPVVARALEGYRQNRTLPAYPQSSGQALQPFMATGPYGQQAMQLAGLLGGRSGIPRPVGGAQINTQLGDKARMPLYRPVGK